MGADRALLEQIEALSTTPATPQQEPARMDAPDGPVCGCGRPSTHESGWCGVCCEFPPQDEEPEQEDEEDAA